MSVVAVVTSSPPMAEGGHLVIARSLVSALSASGHEADLVTTPQNRFGRQGAAYLATWLTDVGRTADGRMIDRVISTRFPSYAVRHPRHVCWLNHTMREYYDLWDRFKGTLSRRSRMKESVRRRLVHAVDRWLLTNNVSTVFAQSRTIQARLQRWGGITSTVLYPPPPPREYRCDGYEPYFLAVSRCAPLKRLDLVVKALAEAPARGLRAVVAGDGETRPDLVRLAADLGVSDRVTFPGRLDDEHLVGHLARCRAVVFPPYDEDYGFVTVEAFASGKPVITCRDSGGPTEFVESGVTGLVTDPTPAGLAAAMRHLADDEACAARMGVAGRARVAPLTWPATVDRLLAV